MLYKCDNITHNADCLRAMGLTVWQQRVRPSSYLPFTHVQNRGACSCVLLPYPNMVVGDQAELLQQLLFYCQSTPGLDHLLLESEQVLSAEATYIAHLIKDYPQAILLSVDTLTQDMNQCLDHPQLSVFTVTSLISNKNQKRTLYQQLNKIRG